MSTGERALTELAEPTMTWCVTGVVPDSLPTDTPAPEGLDAKPRFTVWGSRRTVALFESPEESTAVSSSSRYDGFSWSGAGNEPLSTPSKPCAGWAWQPWFRGQW